MSPGRGQATLFELSFAKTPPADQVVDLPPAPLASTPPDPLRRPPPGRSGEPRLAPATRRLQRTGRFPARPVPSGSFSPVLTVHPLHRSSPSRPADAGIAGN